MGAGRKCNTEAVVNVQADLHLSNPPLLQSLHLHPLTILHFSTVVPGGSEDNQDSACNAGDPGLIPGWERSPGEGNGNPLQYSCSGESYGPWQPTPIFLPGESHGLRRLVGCSPQGHKESDTTGWLYLLMGSQRVGQGWSNLEHLHHSPSQFV